MGYLCLALSLCADHFFLHLRHVSLSLSLSLLHYSKTISLCSLTRPCLLFFFSYPRCLYCHTATLFVVLFVVVLFVVVLFVVVFFLSAFAIIHSLTAATLSTYGLFSFHTNRC
ncbi:MAG: hypothetical protein J3R72DRAFT_255913 [Linnemannia gamsii]|nr:MAG: hypothetical protein J3R72DRAFT_255913 [Linnemannia gamsii]